MVYFLYFLMYPTCIDYSKARAQVLAPSTCRSNLDEIAEVGVNAIFWNAWLSRPKSCQPNQSPQRELLKISRCPHKIRQHACTLARVGRGTDTDTSPHVAHEPKNRRHRRAETVANSTTFSPVSAYAVASAAN